MNIVVVGGGSAGWMVASYVKRFLKRSNVTLIESPKVGIIGVGESVTVHVPHFLRKLGVDEHDMMRKTGSVYKYGNNFINWKNGHEQELFTFRWNIGKDNLLNFIKHLMIEKNNFQKFKKLNLSKLKDYTSVRLEEPKLTDYILNAYKDKKFSQEEFNNKWSAYDYFSKFNKSPHQGNEMIFGIDGLQHAFHINAEKFGTYIKENIGIPYGVVYKIGHVSNVVLDNNDHRIIDKLILENGEEISADLFIDCTGFHRSLISKLNRERKHYPTLPADTAIVCQVDYDDPEKELANHTKTIAMKQGWAFDISLYHRKGTGYIYGSDFVKEDELMDEYRKTMLTNPKMEPRKIKWEKTRLINAAEGNVVAIGMSNGFLEPMEANLFAIMINGIYHLVDAIEKHGQNLNNIDWTYYNKLMSNTYDDIAEFVLVHYTLSSRDDSDFWKEMKSLGIREKHDELLISRYHDERNTFKGAANGHSIYPDYMWLQVAVGWGLDLEKWPRKKLSDDFIFLSDEYIKLQEETMMECSKTFPNNYEFHKTHIFQNMSCKEFEETLK